MLKYFTERIRFGENGGIQHEVGHDQDEEVDQHTEGELVDGDDGNDNGDAILSIWVIVVMLFVMVVLKVMLFVMMVVIVLRVTMVLMILRRRAVTWVRSLKKMLAASSEVFNHIVWGIYDNNENIDDN